ncbi:MAG: DNA polymerase III subunit epsilon [Steroidobacteraceae bacterium]
MRQIVLDTETTGLEVSEGHRVIEIGCVELLHRRPSGRTWHRYLKPDREIDAAALAVHGITGAFLAAQPGFAEIAGEFLEFIAGAELVIHNAPFDVGFLDAELARVSAGSTIAEHCSVLDTLALARRMHPGQRNSLDALCKRYGVDNSRRELHGALLDARILADVYLAMSGGQAALGLDAEAAAGPARAAGRRIARGAVRIPVIRANSGEIAAHEQLLDGIERSSGGHALFRAGRWDNGKNR